MDKLKLLRAIYKALQWDRLYELFPGVSRRQIDELFREIRDALGARPAPAEFSSRGAEKQTPERPAAASAGGTADLYCDGASLGNPGPSGIGMVLRTSEGLEMLAWGESIGRATSNVAEYRALVAGLTKALELEVRCVRVLSDSELLCRQITGQYRVKSPRLKPLHGEATSLLSRFERWKITRIPREENQQAHALASTHAKPDS